MRLWLLIIAVSLTQELASSNAVFLTAYQSGYPLIAIHIVYALCTIFDIVVFYALGMWVHRKFPHSRIIAWVQKFSHELEVRAGVLGHRAAIFLIGILNFTQLSAFAFAWLPFRFREIALILFISDMVAYALQWMFLFGVQYLFPSRTVAFALIVILPLVGFSLLRFLKEPFERF